MTPGTASDRPLAVTLSVLTYRRTDGMQRAVASMLATAVPGQDDRWTLAEILVVDNNPDGSAKPAVDALAEEASPLVRYTHEPEPGIVAARNRAIDEAVGDVLVFIDDDEIALPGWPAGLLSVMASTGAAMVGGPVISEFVQEPEPWVRETGFFDQPPRPDGSEATWLSTCNVAIDLAAIRANGLRFDPRYPHGEDATLSRTAAKLGLGLAWSATATVKEFVGPERTTLAWRRERHRISTDAWARAELDLDPSVRTELVLLARAGSRLVQGVATVAAGTMTRRTATRYRGLALLSQARGGFDGVVRHRKERRGG